MKKLQSLTSCYRKVFNIIGLLSIVILCTSCEDMLHDLGKVLLEIFFMMLIGFTIYFGTLILVLFNLKTWKKKQLDLTEVIKRKIRCNKERYPHLSHWLEKEGDLVSQIFPFRDLEYSEPIISLLDDSNNVVWQHSFKYYMLNTALEKLDVILSSFDAKATPNKEFLNPFALEKSKNYIFLSYFYNLVLTLLFGPLLCMVFFFIFGDATVSFIPFFVLIVFLLFLTWKLVISLMFNKR